MSTKEAPSFVLQNKGKSRENKQKTKKQELRAQGGKETSQKPESPNRKKAPSRIGANLGLCSVTDFVWGLRLGMSFGLAGVYLELVHRTQRLKKVFSCVGLYS
jgi:hypothetical protein